MDELLNKFFPKDKIDILKERLKKESITYYDWEQKEFIVLGPIV